MIEPAQQANAPAGCSAFKALAWRRDFSHNLYIESHDGWANVSIDGKLSAGEESIQKK